jgi:hypothetical protein
MDLPSPKKFEIKYGCEWFEEGNNFLHRNFFRFKMDFELKFEESRSIFYCRKLIKITTNGLKYRHLHECRKSNLEHFSCW